MQTTAEKCLILNCQEILERKAQKQDLVKVIDIGAAKSVVIEEALRQKTDKFICDRTDVDDPRVDHPNAGSSFICPIERMPGVQSDSYDLAFSNFVLEHATDLKAGAAEVFRVLKAGASYVVSIPNPEAPEFILAKHTPTWFHQYIKGKGDGMHAYDTHYAYKNINEVIRVFESCGFKLIDDKRFAFTHGYMYRFPILSRLSIFYDEMVNLIGIKEMMSHACLVFVKQANESETKS